ncbi:MAG: hypothetical protein KatS3mg036_0013 [Ignavibacterium sp.]|nr:MAG: hypothetical protein KatS3mg036_0013 [Ignavibacterium sp.]
MLLKPLDWMNDIDRQYKITNDDYGMGDFIEDLKKQGYIKEDENGIQLYTNFKDRSYHTEKIS